MGSKKTEERLNMLESALEAILQRLDAVKKKIEPVDNLSKRVDDTDSKQAIHELSVEDQIKDLGIETDSKVVTSELRSEEKIKDLGEKFKEHGDKDDRQIVVLVGTNDIKGEEVVLSKYKCLIDESNKIKNGKVSVVGIPRRLDLSTVHNSRRIGVNKRLKELCEAMNVEFIDYEPLDNRLARDGLHLNHLGQDDLGRKIFQHCKRFLM